MLKKLTFLRLNENLDKIDEVESICNSLFGDQFPMPKNIFAFLSIEKIGDTLLFQQDGKTVGFLIYFETEKLFYIWYLAVFPEYRSQGFGSDILNFLKEYAEDTNRVIYLDMEWPDPDAPDNEERIKRKKFYEKHGFFTIGKPVKLYGSMTQIITNKKIDRKVLREENVKLDAKIESKIQSLDDNFFDTYGGDRDTFLKTFNIIAKERTENATKMFAE